MKYEFLIETYATERLKVVSVWSQFRDTDLEVRPSPDDPRGRSVHEQMVHQCVSENLWFMNMFGIDIGAPPLPKQETRLEFMQRYAEDSGKRLTVLGGKDESWWEADAKFFDTQKPRTWIMVRRIAHTAQHRGEMTALLRLLGRQVHSVYGPSVDTGGLPDNSAPTIYAYPDIESLIAGESRGGAKTVLPGPGDKPSTERPDR